MSRSALRRALLPAARTGRQLVAIGRFEFGGAVEQIVRRGVPDARLRATVSRGPHGVVSVDQLIY